jgi:hypothetical protein
MSDNVARYIAHLSLNPWMGDFAWSSTWLPWNAAGCLAVAHA